MIFSRHLSRLACRSVEFNSSSSAAMMTMMAGRRHGSTLSEGGGDDDSRALLNQDGEFPRVLITGQEEGPHFPGRKARQNNN